MSRNPINLKRRISDVLALVPGPTLAVAIFILILITTASVIAAGYASPWHSLTDSSHLIGNFEFLTVFILGALFGMLFSKVGQSGWPESAGCLWLSARRAGITVGMVGFILLTGFVWLGSALINAEKRDSLIEKLILKDPGGLFAAFMGLVTIIGFAVTLHDLREIRRRITTFPDLISRLNSMLKDLGQNDVLRFLAYTPSLGYIALEDRDFIEFYRAVVGLDANNKPKVDMVCLSKKDLKEWHDLFIGRRTRRKKLDTPGRVTAGGPQKPEEPGRVDQNLADHATLEGEHIVDLIAGEAVHSNDENRVSRLPFEFLPGYYFFVSPDRVLVVAPLQLPFPKGAPKSAQEKHGTVQMLGFETNDRAIIRDFTDLHESYKRLPSSYVAEHIEVIKGDEFPAWCKPSSPHWQAAMDCLLQQYKVASGTVAPHEDNQDETTLFRDYGKYFVKDKLAHTKLEVTFRLSLKEEAPDQLVPSLVSSDQLRQAASNGAGAEGVSNQ
jgi:hypothetical protein